MIINQSSYHLAEKCKCLCYNFWQLMQSTGILLVNRQNFRPLGCFTMYQIVYSTCDCPCRALMLAVWSLCNHFLEQKKRQWTTFKQDCSLFWIKFWYCLRLRSIPPFIKPEQEWTIPLSCPKVARLIRY